MIGNGLPVQLELTPGQANDAPMAELLLDGLPADADVTADKGYDADWIRDMIAGLSRSEKKSSKDDSRPKVTTRNRQSPSGRWPNAGLGHQPSTALWDCFDMHPPTSDPERLKSNVI